MPEDLKLSQVSSSLLPSPFRGLHSPGVRKHCQIIFAFCFRKSSVHLYEAMYFICTPHCQHHVSNLRKDWVLKLYTWSNTASEHTHTDTRCTQSRDGKKRYFPPEVLLVLALSIVGGYNYIYNKRNVWYSQVVCVVTHVLPFEHWWKIQSADASDRLWRPLVSELW